MKRTRWKMALVNIVKKSLSEERKEKSVILNSKRSKTTKKNSWVDKDLTKPKNYKEQNHYELSGRRPKQIPFF